MTDALARLRALQADDLPVHGGRTLAYVYDSGLPDIDRIDFSKGSNSLIYGDSIPGGMANSYTKRPRFRNSGEVSFSAISS